jgi:dephospho-CoA kinase
MLMAGLTGNFGMGKSYVLSLFRDLGAVTLDSDRIVALLLRNEDVIKKIMDIFGPEVVGPDGKLDKKSIAGRIFSDDASKKALEALLHPLVFEKIDAFTARIKKRDCLVIVEVPLLFEGEYQERFDKIVTVHTPEETALERLIKAGLSRQEALARLGVQLPVEIKKARSDYTIDNSGTKEETKRRVEEVYRLLVGK